MEGFTFEDEGFRSSREGFFGDRKGNVVLARNVGVVPVVGFAVFRVELAEGRIRARERFRILYAEVFVVGVVQMLVFLRDSEDSVREIPPRACGYERSRKGCQSLGPEGSLLFGKERFGVFELGFREGKGLFRLRDAFRGGERRS